MAAEAPDVIVRHPQKRFADDRERPDASRATRLPEVRLRGRFTATFPVKTTEVSLPP